MKDWIYIAIISLLACEILLNYLNRKKPDKTNYTQDYQGKLLLTKNEWTSYKKLEPVLESAELRICPKVRLLDLIEPKKGTEAKKRQVLLNKVQSKHIDFVICDSSMHVKLCLELDDSSHDRADRQQRDEFVDSVLTNCGYQVLHVRSVEKELPSIQSALGLIENQPAQA